MGTRRDLIRVFAGMLLGAGVLLWQRTTAELRAEAAWRAQFDQRLTHLETLPEKLDEFKRGQANIREDVAWIKARLQNGGPR